MTLGKSRFRPNFFSLKPQGNVCYGFFGGFHPRNVQPLKFLRYLKARARSGPQRAQEGIIFIRRDIIKISVPRHKTSWVYHMTWRVSIGSERAGRNLTSKFDFLKMSRFTPYLWPGRFNPFQPEARNIP